MLVNGLEILGSVAGLAGAFLLATNTSISRWGWVLFLVANVALIGFSIGIERVWLLIQQMGFMATSLLGLYRTGFFGR
jgi:hypothetical protein